MEVKNYSFIKNDIGTIAICESKELDRLNTPRDLESITLTLPDSKKKMKFVKVDTTLLDLESKHIIFLAKKSAVPVAIYTLETAANLINLLDAFPLPVTETYDLFEICNIIDNLNIYISEKSNIRNGGLVLLRRDNYFALVASAVYEDDYLTNAVKNALNI